MKVVPYQEILEKKFKRQRELLAMGAELHANGHCFHYGKISFGCRDCYTGEQSINLFQGTQCMCKCPYCYYNPSQEEILLTEQQEQKEIEIQKMKLREFENYRPAIVSYCSAGETLLYLDIFERYAAELYPLIYAKNINPYTFLYTNGILCNRENLERLKGIHVDEIRFHISASNFAPQVLENMRLAKEMGFLITVEEPSYPLNREKLFELLPFFEEIGLNHLDLIELHLTEYNKKRMEELYPGEEYLAFKDYFYHLYDNGLVYDIMEECIKKGYHFSVIDCNSGVERCRNNIDQDVLFDWKSVEGMCADWDTGAGFVPRMKNGKKYSCFLGNI